ncbi:MAG: LuxR C-terminal-related transcriptional regulator [Bilifractor sp.]
MGKTAAVEYYFRRKSCRTLSGMKGYFDAMPDYKDIQENAIFFDDISEITDIDSENYVREILDDNTDKMIVLAGRGRVPEWLSPYSIQMNFEFADNSDLQFTKENLEELFKEDDSGLLEDDCGFLLRLGKTYSNNTLMYILIRRNMEKGEPYTDQVRILAEKSIFQYMNRVFFERKPRDIQGAILSLCHFSSFSTEMAKVITGNGMIDELFNRMQERGDFIGIVDATHYRINDFYRKYLLWKSEVTYSDAQIEKIYERAALFYEMSGDSIHALECYRKAKNTERIISLLCDISDKNPGMEIYQSVEKYFEQIPVATISKYPTLMSAEAMICSLSFDPDRSEQWVERLREFAQKAGRGSAGQIEAYSRLLFLDIILPHRGTAELLQSLKNVSSVTRGWADQYSEVSITDNCPSILNGGLDMTEFFELNKNNYAMVEQLDNAVKLLLRRNAVGYVQLGYLENAHERLEISFEDMSTKLNEIYMQTDARGTLETSYVAIALLTKLYITQGLYSVAEASFEGFVEKIRRSGNNSLKSGLETFRMWMSLLKGEVSRAREWLPQAPDFTVSFSFLDRYFYLNKLRVFIAFQKYEQANDLCDRLKPVFERYHRPYMAIQNSLFKSVILFRQGKEDWREYFMRALEHAQAYRYHWVIAMEGAAVKPLLDSFDGGGIDPEYLQNVRKLVDKMASYYPKYLQPVEEVVEPLTAMERRTLHLICSGMNSEEICDSLNISYSGLKFHRQNIYRKLNVNNRLEAMEKARSLGLD